MFSELIAGERLDSLLPLLNDSTPLVGRVTLEGNRIRTLSETNILEKILNTQAIFSNDYEFCRTTKKIKIIYNMRREEFYEAFHEMIFFACLFVGLVMAQMPPCRVWFYS